jgi:thiamine transport system permease protein
VDADRRSLTSRAWPLVAYGVPLAFLAVFFVYPLSSIVERGIGSAGGDSAIDVLGDPLTRDVLWFTTWLAAASTLLTLVVSFPVTYVLGRYDFAGRDLVLALVVVPFVLPTIVVALAFLAILPAGLERGPFAILLAHTFFNVAVVVRIVGTFWAGLDRRLTDAAATLGAGPWQRFRHVTLPLLAPALASAAAIVFLFSFTSFGIVVILGGPGYATLEVEIYNQAVRAFDLHAAAVLSLVQLLCVALTVAVVGRLEGRLAARGELRPERSVLRRPRTGREKLVVVASLGTLGLFLVIPLLAVFERSLSAGSGHGVEGYRALARPTSTFLATPWEAVLNSIMYATAATAIALVVGGLAAFALARPGSSKVVDGLLMLPLGASAVMLGFGFVIAFDEGWRDFRSEPWIVPVVQALVAIPFVIRIVAPTLRAIDPREREAAALLGASPQRVLREIDLPVATRGLAVAAGFAFAISLGEFGATVFLARADRPTLPVAIFRFLGRPGELNVAQAYALAVILILVAAASLVLVGRVGRRAPSWL